MKKKVKYEFGRCFKEGSKLTLLYETLPGKRYNGYDRRRAVFLCECGSLLEAFIDCVSSGNTSSCGCIKRELDKKKAKGLNYKDGRTNHYLYYTWLAMNNRCHNPNTTHYSYYGERGISVCDKWRNSFFAFAEDVGERPEGFSLDRIDNDGNYTPENVRWADKITQMNNRRK